ncbi:hypothetical protein HKX48_002062 [Thoreauomyces humboldtii]|nr:hypothetical protein HKX48_002062 [Thoreauomyces humboldtii]
MPRRKLKRVDSKLRISDASSGSSSDETAVSPESRAAKKKTRMFSVSSSSSSSEDNIPVAAAPRAAKKREMTMSMVAQRVEKGETLVIYEDRVYNVTPFLKYHPGGELVVKHMAGCDATDEINGLHPRWVIDDRMPRYHIADLVPEDSISTSSEKDAADEETAATKKRVRDAYVRLEKKIRDAGLFDTNPWYYVAHIVEYAVFLTIGIVGVVYGTQWWHYLTSAVFMGAFWQQTAFAAHDAGHNGITHVREWDATIGIFLGNFCGGLSIGWWKKSHYVHHIATNHPEHDPDIQQLPFFALSKRFLDNLHSSFYNRTMHFTNFAKAMVPFQHLYYYVVLCFARFLLYVLGWTFILTEPNYDKRHLEMAGMTFYFTWLTTLVSQLPNWKVRAAWIMLSHASTVFLHIQICVSHFSMSTEDMGKHEPFPAKMLRTTMDVMCHPMMDWFHGGLQFQAIHHLFPRVPRHNLRRCIPFVETFAEEAGVVYTRYHFVEANGHVLNHMRAIGQHVALLAKVAHSEAVGDGEHHHHHHLN